MYSRVWSESFWLESNITWEHISNGPGKLVVYAEVKDFFSVVPLTMLILIVRFFCERHVYIPLGNYFKINNPKVRQLIPNTVLETEYQKSVNKRKNATALAKQLDLTERQIERWWSLRRRQDKQTILVKFSESMWRGCSFLFRVSVGIYAVWRQDWAWDPIKSFENHPHQGLSPGIWWFYMLTTAYYTSVIITQFHDVRRKDFWQMFYHHIITMLLLFICWPTQYFRAGCLVILLHDGVDIVLEFGKAFKYAKCHRIVDCLLPVFVILWVVCRLVWFPFYVMPAAYPHRYKSPITQVIAYLVLFLFLLTLYWTWLIIQVVLKVIRSGGLESDIRSSGSEESDISSSSEQ